MDEPGWTGLVAFRNGRRELSAPARTAGLTRSVTLTPEERFDRRVAPSAIVIRTAGIVMLSSVPPMPAAGLSETLSATSIAIAPAFWQFLALTTNVHVRDVPPDRGGVGQGRAGIGRRRAGRVRRIRRRHDLAGETRGGELPSKR